MTGSAVAVQGANTVGSSDIKPRSVKRSDLARNSVNSSKVLNRSLRSEDFARGQLPRGPKGLKGPRGLRGFNGPAGPAGVTGPSGATRVAGEGASVAALEREGAEGINSVSGRGWDDAQADTRLRVSRAAPDNNGAENFLITPYQWGMAIEYPGVVEAWVSDFSIHRGGNSLGARLWVGNDDDTGGILAQARNRGPEVWGEVATQKFGGGSNGPLRLRTVNEGDGVEVWNGRSESATRKLALGTVGPSSAAGITFGQTGDVNLYRWAAGVLKTDGKLLADAGLGVGNSEAATNPGSVVRKMEVFDANGASLGFVPIYDTID